MEIVESLKLYKNLEDIKFSTVAVADLVDHVDIDTYKLERGKHTFIITAQ